MIAVLRNQDFLRAWLSHTASALATALMPAAITLAVLDRVGGVQALGLVLAFRTVGFIGGVLPAGVIADRLPRPVVLCGASALRAVGTLAVLVFLQGSLVITCAAVALVGAGEGVFRTAYQALVGQVVAEDERQAANAATTLTLRLALIVGPGVASLVYVAKGARVALGAALLLWSGSAILAATLRVASPKESSKANVFRDFGAGLLEARRHTWFLSGIVALAIWLGFGYSLQQLLLPVISRREYGGETLFATALGMYSLGALLGALLMARVKPRKRGVAAFVGLSLYAAVPATLAVGNPAAILCAYACGGLGLEVFNVLWFTAIQKEVPKEVQARISSLDFLVSYALSPLTLAALPPVITHLGEKRSLLSCTVLVAGTCLVMLVSRSAREFTSEGHVMEPIKK